MAYRIQSTAVKNPRGVLKDYEEEDCGSGTEADNEETEEERNYNSEYDQEDEDRENSFYDNDDNDGPMDMEINPKKTASGTTIIQGRE